MPKIIILFFYTIFVISIFIIDNITIWFIAFEGQNVCIYYLLYSSLSTKWKNKAKFIQQYLTVSIFSSLFIASLISLLYLQFSISSFHILGIFIKSFNFYIYPGINFLILYNNFIIILIYLMIYIFFFFKLGIFPFNFLLYNLYKLLDASSLIFFISLPKITYFLGYSLYIYEYLNIIANIFINESINYNSSSFIYNYINIESFIIILLMSSTIFFIFELFYAKTIKNQIINSSLISTNLTFLLLLISIKIYNIVAYFIFYSLSIAIIISFLSNIVISVNNKRISFLDTEIIVSKILPLNQKVLLNDNKILTLYKNNYLIIFFIYSLISLFTFPGSISFLLKIASISDSFYLLNFSNNVIIMYSIIVLTLAPMSYFRSIFSFFFYKKTKYSNKFTDIKDNNVIFNFRIDYLNLIFCFLLNFSVWIQISAIHLFNTFL